MLHLALLQRCTMAAIVLTPNLFDLAVAERGDPQLIEQPVAPHTEQLTTIIGLITSDNQSIT